MRLEYIPLLGVLRDLYRLPRGPGRFEAYLRAIANETRDGLRLAPLVLANPMAREPVAERIDALLALDAEGEAARAVAEALPAVADVPGSMRVGLVVADDLKRGWTNRFASEFAIRFGPGVAFRDDWLVGILWSSDEPSALAAREAVLMAVHRAAHVHRHGPAKTLRERLAQEGHAMAASGCDGPALDADDLEYTREVLAPALDETAMSTTIECLFGDLAARSLGFAPRGLSPGAGLALARHEACRGG